MSRPARIAAVALLAVAVVGAVSLSRGGRADMVAALDQPLEPAALASAQSLLDSRQIPCRCEAGKLLVLRRDLAQTRTLLAAGGLLPKDNFSPLQQAARDSDVWSTQVESERRWLTAKMAALSGQLEKLDPIGSATVILEPGQTRKIGGPATPPTAAVRVTLKAGAVMDSKLIDAVADQVAGSVAGMGRENVRIIDNTGRSYRANEPSPEALGSSGRSAAAERRYQEKIESALRFVDKLIVVVAAEDDAAPAKRFTASVSVPRSYLAEAYRSAYGEDPAEADIASAAETLLDRLRQNVTQAIGAEAPVSLKLDWYYDTVAKSAAPATPRPVAAASPSWLARNARECVAGAMVLLGAFSLVVLLRRRRRKSSPLQAAAAPAAAQVPSVPEVEAPGELPEPSSTPFAFLQQVSVETMQSLLRDELPQTAAVVLVHLRPPRAAAVLAGFPPPRQVEIAGRIAALEKLDDSVVRDVEQSLLSRLAELTLAEEGRVGGVGAVAEILHHAGLGTERAVLEGLAGEEPTLADSIRRRIFAFDDLGRLPRRRLGTALEEMDSEEIAVALRTAGDDLVEKVLQSLPAGMSREVRDEMDSMGPVRLSDVEAAQQQIVEAVRSREAGLYVPAEQDESARTLDNSL